MAVLSTGRCPCLCVQAPAYTGNYWQKEELTAYTSSHNVDEVIFKIIPEAVTLNNALATGEIDISAMLDAMYVGDYLGKDGYNAQSFQDNITKYLIFNNNVFPDAAARQAIATAIDVQDLITFAYNGTGAKAASTLGNSNYPDYLTSWEEEEYYVTQVRLIWIDLFLTIKTSQSFRSNLCTTALLSLLGVSLAASSALFYANHPRKSL